MELAQSQRGMGGAAPAQYSATPLLAPRGPEGRLSLKLCDAEALDVTDRLPAILSIQGRSEERKTQMLCG